MTTARQSSHRAAVTALVLATAFWGCSFTWIKRGGAGVNAALGLGETDVVGPVFFMAVRFLAAAVLWLVFRPGTLAALAASSRATIRRGLVVGLVLWLSSIAQVVGLGYTSEAVSAFLTSLTVVIVPLTMTFALRRPPRPVMWVAVGLATTGIWMMTGATPTGFGIGELLGLMCAVFFGVHIIVYNHVAPGENIDVLTWLQFTIVGIASAITVAAMGHGEALMPPTLGRILATGTDSVALSFGGLLGSHAIWLNLVEVTLVSTVLAYGIVFAFQPAVTPTRAAIVYLAEPVFASAFAFVAVGSTLTPMALTGAGLILLANLAAEVQGSGPDEVTFPASPP